MKTHLVLALVLVLCCACGSPARSTTTAQSSPHVAQIASAADYELHEWGLVRAEAGDVLRAGAVAPQVNVVPLIVFKPVLYFHTAAPLTLHSVVVRASEGGAITEVWPLAPFGAQVRWDGVTLDPSGTCAVSALPTATDPPCVGLPANDLCESAGLAVARTTDGACVRVGSAVERFLFYRARVTRFTPPLAFERTSTPDEVRVTNEGTLPIPGFLVRIRQAAGTVTTLAVEPPAPGTSITVGASATAGAPTTLLPQYRFGGTAPSPGAAALRTSMLTIGLSEPEADAFLAAWNDTLFGVPLVLDTSAEQLRLVDPAPVESFVYFLPEPSTDGIARLELDPPPRATLRAIAVWSVLSANGSSH